MIVESRFVPSAQDSRRGASGETMSRKNRDAEELVAECDFSKGVRGKYVERLRMRSTVVVLDPDVASEFDSPRAVNRALRFYLETKKKRGAE